MNYRKKLIEVALPLEAINVASAREKSIRHGHPSTLHLWWARRPLAACRAVLFASLVDDPNSDPAFDIYKTAEDREHATGAKRQQLFDLITELVQWENSNNELVINAARAEIARCVASRKIETGELKKDLKLKGGETVWDLVVKGHGNLEQLRAGKCRLPKAESVNAFLAEHAPPVLDPFCGGGSIPLEAQRLGLRAHASDLNPVPVLINKALIEIPPKFENSPPINPDSRHESGPPGKKSNGTGKALIEGGWKGAQGLAEDVRYYGKWMRDEAEKRIGKLYPKVKMTAEMAKGRKDLKPYIGEELCVIAWLWAHTVLCANPACAKQMPLTRSFSVLRKGAEKAWIQPLDGQYVMNVDSDDATPGTVNRKGATCVWCSTHASFEYVKAEGRAKRMGTAMIGIIADGGSKRLAVSPIPEHIGAASKARPTWRPDVEMAYNPFSVRPPLYGFKKFSDIHSDRQTCALDCLSNLIADVRNKIRRDYDGARANRSFPENSGGSTGMADAISTYLGLAIGRSANYWSCLTPWGGEFIVQTFGRQALPMIWDYAEGNPFSDSTGNWMGAIDWIARCLVQSVPACGTGVVTQLDARTVDHRASHLVCTDPPYYNNIDYADLSDFFYVWLRHALSDVYPQLFSTVLVPKAQELVATPYRFDGDKDRAKDFFESGLLAAFDKCGRAQNAEWPFTVFYAFKQTEEDNGDEDEGNALASVASTGWETMLEGLILSGFSIDGTWPLRTERDQGLKTRMNALASSVVLVCRPRPVSSPLATRREFLNALKQELPDALKHLQRGNIAPVDLAQAAIGPGMSVFTRYTKVMEADGTAMKVRQALALINQTLDQVLAEQEGEFDGDTRWAVAWFEQFGMDEGAFGVAEILSKAKNTGINGLVEAGLIAAKGGKVRLLKRAELPGDWDPATDTRLRHWEIVQHLIRVLETGGESAAADLRRKLGGMGDMARDLAYRLYSICERKKWSQEALAYNGLVIAWPEITKLAQSAGASGTKESQGAMF